MQTFTDRPSELQPTHTLIALPDTNDMMPQSGLLGCITPLSSR